MTWGHTTPRVWRAGDPTSSRKSAGVQPPCPLGGGPGPSWKLLTLSNQASSCFKDSDPMILLPSTLIKGP